MKGARGIDGSKGEDFLNKGEDYAKKNSPRDLSAKFGNEFKGQCPPWEEPTWKPGPVGTGGGSPKHDSYATGPVEPASPTGKYAKKGGSGQRSGQ